MNKYKFNNLLSFLILSILSFLFVIPSWATDYNNMLEIGNITNIERRYSRPYHQLYRIDLTIATYAPNNLPTYITWTIEDVALWNKVQDSWISNWCPTLYASGGSDCTVGSPPSCGYDYTKVSCFKGTFGACLYVEGYALRDNFGIYTFNGTGLLTNYWNCSH